MSLQEKDTANIGACQLASERGDVAPFEFGGQGLLLDKLQSNSNDVENRVFESCPNPINIKVEMVLHTDEGDLYRSLRLPCGKWNCPVCGKRNAAKLKKRLLQGVTALVPTLQADEEKARYSIKFLTLTVGGKAYRASRSPGQAETEMKSNFVKLYSAAKRKFGKFQYVWVMEFQNDGFPHLHVLLVGNAIAPRGILEYIRSLWCRRYGMGFVKVNCASGEYKKAVNYLTGYVSKGLQTGLKGYRVYSMSGEMSRLSKLEKIPVTVIRVFKITEYEEGITDYRVLYEVGSYYPELEKIKNQVQATLQGEKAQREVQLGLWSG